MPTVPSGMSSSEYVKFTLVPLGNALVPLGKAFERTISARQPPTARTSRSCVFSREMPGVKRVRYKLGLSVCAVGKGSLVGPSEV